MPQKHQNGFYSLLTQKRSDIIRVDPVLPPEVAELAYDLKDGSFDLVASSKDNDGEVVNGKFVPGNLLLLRIWRTDQYYTYNQITGQVNKLVDDRKKLFRSKSEKYQVLPDINKWNYNVDEANNYYKKYLIQDEIDNKLNQQEQARKQRYRHSLPDLQHTYTLKRQASFTSDISPEKNSFYQRYLRGEIPLQVNL